MITTASPADLNTPLPEFTLRTLHLEKKITNEDLEDLLCLMFGQVAHNFRVEHPFLEEISKTIPIIGLNYKDEKTMLLTG